MHQPLEHTVRACVPEYYYGASADRQQLLGLVAYNRTFGLNNATLIVRDPVELSCTAPSSREGNDLLIE